MGSFAWLFAAVSGGGSSGPAAPGPLEGGLPPPRRPPNRFERLIIAIHNGYLRFCRTFHILTEEEVKRFW